MFAFECNLYWYTAGGDGSCAPVADDVQASLATRSLPEVGGCSYTS
jgi:hypothetical protein